MNEIISPPAGYRNIGQIKCRCTNLWTDGLDYWCCNINAVATAQERAAQADPMLQFFAYEHLPPFLREISAPFGQLAREMVATLPRNPERSAGLRKLLEAKDCAVRARLFK